MEKWNLRRYLKTTYGIDPEADLSVEGWSMTYQEIERMLEVAYRDYRDSEVDSAYEYTYNKLTDL